MRQLTQGIRRLCYSSPRIITRRAGLSWTDWTVQRWPDVTALQVETSDSCLHCQSYCIMQNIVLTDSVTQML